MADLSVKRFLAVWLRAAQELQAALLDMQRTLLSHAALAVHMPTLQAGLDTGSARKLLEVDATRPSPSMESAQLLSSVKAQQIHQDLFSRLILTRLTGFSMMMLSIMF